MKGCLIIFAKEPKPGKVKTRLKGYLSEERCAELYKVFLKDTLELARAAKCFHKILAYDAFGFAPRYLKTIAPDFIFYKQRGDDLGERMHNAFKFAKGMKCEKTLIIGSDSPDLPVTYLKEAFKCLDKNDIVLGPVFDGGYYLIGLKKPCLQIFQGVKWSSRSVFKDTLKIAIVLGIKAAVLKKWHDIDKYSDLVFLKQSLKKNKRSAPWTRKFFENRRAGR